MKQQFLEDIPDTFKAYVYENNRKIIPASAALTVYKPGSSEKLLNAQAMTVAGDGLLSYALTDAHNADAAENYKAVIAYVHSSVTYYLTLYYDVVKSKLSIVITDDDIINELPQLRNKGWKAHGTAESGSTTTIVDAELKVYDDDYFTGGTAYSIDQDETRAISDFAQSTGTVTVAAAFSAAVSADQYILTRSFTREIQRAFEKLEDLLNRAGKRAHLVLDPNDLREAHIVTAVAEVCKGMITEEGSMWWSLWQDYDKRGYAIFKSLNLKYDESGDGYISGAESGKRMRRTLGRA